MKAASPALISESSRPAIVDYRQDHQKLLCSSKIVQMLTSFILITVGTEVTSHGSPRKTLEGVFHLGFVIEVERQCTNIGMCLPTRVFDQHRQ
jgi:hypothetical protein